MNVIQGLNFKSKLKNKDFISTEDWDTENLSQILELAWQMKMTKCDPKWSEFMKNKVFLLMFFNPSLRTHISFETAIIELGGYPLFRSLEMGWQPDINKSGESINDIANVLSRYVAGMGIRLTMDKVSYYGEGHATLREYAKWSSVPVLSMADDKFHPCQGLADIMGWTEYLSGHKKEFNIDQLKGKKLLLTWGRSRLTRPWSSVQSHLLLASRFGMNITLASPEGYHLDPEVCQTVQQHCHDNSTEFNVTHDPEEGYDNADIVIVRNWVSPNAYADGKFQRENEIDQALKYHDWIVTEKKMAKTNKAGFANPMPIERNYEAENSVIDSKNSLIYEVAENRLHVQKALLSQIL